MYSRGVTMHDNTFARSRGPASYGLLLKDITDGSLTGNRFTPSDSKTPRTSRCPSSARA